MTSKTNKTRVVVIDDHPILRQGISQLINQQSNFTVVGEAADTKKAITLVQQLKPEVIVLDISMNGASGIETAKDIKTLYPTMKILILSMHDENIYGSRALKAGALGYIMKDEPPEKFVQALQKVSSGEVYVSERFGAKLLGNFATGRRDGGSNPVDILSDRELEVFSKIGEGLGTRAIAEMLHLSVKTIESHRAHIKEKLGLESSTELVHFAIKWQQGEQGVEKAQ
jgi:DNA-binding NarL/FixJ family response regulator